VLPIGRKLSLFFDTVIESKGCSSLRSCSSTGAATDGIHKDKSNFVILQVLPVSEEREQQTSSVVQCVKSV